MNVSQVQQELLSEAQLWVSRFVQESGKFTLFALAHTVDGKTLPIQPDGFSDESGEFQAILGVLYQLRDSEQLSAFVIVKPMTMESQTFAIYDCEERQSGRVLLVQRYGKKLFGGWKFWPGEYREDEPGVFAA